MYNVSTLLDHHMHSEFSEDSTQSMEQLVENALAVGKTHVTFTEHSDLIFQKTSKLFCADIVAYDKHVAMLQQKYPNIKILRGTEIGFEQSISKEINAFIAEHQFDINILSIHSIFEGKDFAMEYRAKGKWEYSSDLVKDYYEATLAAVSEIEGIQIIGHLDYLLRYIDGGSSFDLSPYKDLLVLILEKVIEKEIALDFNTAGIRYGLPFAHPQPYILALYHSLGGRRITLGSDAHVAEDVNFGFGDAIEVLTMLGYDSLTTFETGVAVQIPFQDIRR